MTRFHEHIRAAGHEVSLTEAEKSRMRDTLAAYMALTPHRERIAYERPSRTYGFAFAHRALAMLSVVAVLGSSAGISYAAGSSLPGDALYAIKTHINEPVRGVLASSADAKARWAMDVAAARATEAATLAAEHRLDPTTQSELASSLSAHAQIATALLDDAATSAPETIAQTATRFEARLSEYERLLASIGEDGDSGPVIATAIRTERDHLAIIRDKAEGSSEETGDAHELARGRLDAAERSAKLHPDAFSPAITSSLTESIQVASATIAAAEDQEKHGSTTRDDLRKTLEASERLATFVETGAAIHQKTGLVIDDADTEDHARSRGRSKEVAPTAMMAAPVSDVSGAAESAIAPTSSPSEADEPLSRSGHDERKGRHDEHEHTLRLSVPEP